MIFKVEARFSTYPGSSIQKKMMKVYRKQAQMSQAPDSEMAHITSANILLMEI